MILIITFNCDNTDAIIAKRNDAPEIEFAVNGITQGKSLETKAKQSGLVGQFPIEFEIIIHDPNRNFNRVCFDQSCQGDIGELGLFLIQNDSLPTSINVQQIEEDATGQRIKFEGIFFELGRKNLDFFLYDDFGKSDSITAIVEVFENWSPIVISQIDTIEESDLILKVDLSDSYDQDSVYGGEILSYHFDFGDVEYSVTRPFVLHPFPEKGDYVFDVFVMDNNYQFSEKQQREVEL